MRSFKVKTDRYGMRVKEKDSKREREGGEIEKER